MKVTQQVRNAVNAVNEIVPKCYLVGGAVRDMLMDAEPKDYDFVTPMLPDEIEACIKAAGRHCWSGGKRFGTLGAKVWFNNQWNMVEITTFRHEEYDEGSRHPHVTFGVGDITEELSRHDFTCNSVAVKPDGTLCDPFGGIQDIEDDIIRACGNPTIRFKEDPLRMLRAVRFVSTKGFYIEPVTLKSLERHAHRLNDVSRERWVMELDKLLLGDWVNVALGVMFYHNLFKHLIPELHLQRDYDQHSPYHAFPLDMHTRKVVDHLQSYSWGECGGIEREESLMLLWAGLLHDVGKPFTQTFKRDGQANYIHHDVVGAEIVKGIAHRLKWSKARTKAVHNLVLHHITDPDPRLKAADDGGQKR